MPGLLEIIFCLSLRQLPEAFLLFVDFSQNQIQTVFIERKFFLKHLPDIPEICPDKLKIIC